MSLPSEAETSQARAEAESIFRRAQARWEEVHDATQRIEQVRRNVGPDPFVAELERAMKKRHREA